MILTVLTVLTVLAVLDQSNDDLPVLEISSSNLYQGSDTWSIIVMTSIQDYILVQ